LTRRAQGGCDAGDMRLRIVSWNIENLAPWLAGDDDRDFVAQWSRLCPPSRIAAYTCTVFHLPRVNSHSVNSPTEVSDANTAQNTPFSACPRAIARYQASGIWISQKKTTLIFVGVIVSPAPLNACTATIHQP
jgi:hypothetical protein